MMGKYVMVHPALKETVATTDFENGNEKWSHAIKDKDGDRVLFGSYDFDPVDFTFNRFRLRVRSKDGFRVFTWDQAREFAETIIALADKHEEKR